jgi:poly-gamma-glutamate synthase PgsB/CapB
VDLICSAALLAGLLAFLLWERRARDAALAAVPIRVHVNGTRGKSTVTRLIAGALREAGIPTLAKTTGTAPRLILPDGSERAIRRRAPASIREQLWLLREARRARARAVVVECMAIDPDLQHVSEAQMIRSTLGVITNARLDHGEVMGATEDEVADALGATVPRGGVIVVGPTAGADVIARVAAARGSRLVRAGAAAAGPGGLKPWMAENVGIALAAARELGVAEEVARRGFAAAAPDPGTLHAGTIVVDGRRVPYVDASAANDPQSLALVLGERREAALFVFHHRADRPARLGQFHQTPPWSRDDDAVVITGDRPDWTTWRRLRARMPGDRAAFNPRRTVAAELRRRLAAPVPPSLVVFCGNTKGAGVHALVAAVGQA